MGRVKPPSSRALAHHSANSLQDRHANDNGWHRGFDSIAKMASHGAFRICVFLLLAGMQVLGAMAYMGPTALTSSTETNEVALGLSQTVSTGMKFGRKDLVSARHLLSDDDEDSSEDVDVEEKKEEKEEEEKEKEEEEKEKEEEEKENSESEVEAEAESAEITKEGEEDAQESQDERDAELAEGEEEVSAEIKEACDGGECADDKDDADAADEADNALEDAVEENEDALKTTIDATVEAAEAKAETEDDAVDKDADAEAEETAEKGEELRRRLRTLRTSWRRLSSSRSFSSTMRLMTMLTMRMIPATVRIPTMEMTTRAAGLPRTTGFGLFRSGLSPSSVALATACTGLRPAQTRPRSRRPR